jgi:hypothetical protein
VCEFFRHGQCTKGFKCKFSHDLNVERKSAKIDLFTDQRDLEKEEVRPGGVVGVRQNGRHVHTAGCFFPLGREYLRPDAVMCEP